MRVASAKVVVECSLLRWYVEHGVDIKVICRTIRHLVCTAGEGSPAHRRCGQEESSAGRGVQTAGKQRLWESYWSAGATNKRNLNKKKVVDRTLRSTNVSDLDVLEQAYKLKSRKPCNAISRPFADRNCCVSADKGENVRVLL